MAYAPPLLLSPPPASTVHQVISVCARRGRVSARNKKTTAIFIFISDKRFAGRMKGYWRVIWIDDSDSRNPDHRLSRAGGAEGARFAQGELLVVVAWTKEHNVLAGRAGRSEADRQRFIRGCTAS